MIADPLITPATDKVIEVVRQFDRDDFGYFLENDPELQIAYTACIRAADIEWTDEELAEAVLREKYGDKIDDLMQAWRWQQHLLNPDDPEHNRAAAVHIAVKKWQRHQQQQVRV